MFAEPYHLPHGHTLQDHPYGPSPASYQLPVLCCHRTVHLGKTGNIHCFQSGYGPGHPGIDVYKRQILDLPINTVKLERMFVWQLETNPKSASIAGGLIQIARELGIHIIAEGVETENQLNALNNYQCEYQQGFYYAPTMEQDVLIKVMGTTLDESRVTIEEEKLKMKM